MRAIIIALASLTMFFAVDARTHETGGGELISPSELVRSSGENRIIDVRQATEFADGHVPGAYSAPLKDISETRLTALGLESADHIVLYATSEPPARKAKMLLDIIGYRNVRILAGGFTHWREDSYEIEKGDTVPPSGSAQVENSAAGLTVSPARFDFGVISKAAGIVQTTFQARNISGQDITITGITTSCGCTSAEMDKKVIPAGESGLLTVFFDPNFHKEPAGKFSRTVFLQTSDGTELLAEIEVEIAD